MDACSAWLYELELTLEFELTLELELILELEPTLVYPLKL